MMKQIAAKLLISKFPKLIANFQKEIEDLGTKLEMFVEMKVLLLCLFFVF